MKVGAEKLAVRIARELALSIVAEGWPIGRRLGTEATLLLRFKVSREPFREAVRLLERQGIVRAERGWNGGLTIQAPALTAAANIARTYLEFADVSFSETHQVHHLLQRFGFERAIERMTLAHANTLRRCAQRPAQPFRSRDQEGRALGAVFGAVIEAAANPCLSMLHQMLTRVVADFGHQEKYPARLWSELSKKMWALVADMAESAGRGDVRAALAAVDETFHYVQAVVESLAQNNRRVWNTDSFLCGSYSSAVLAQRAEDKMGVALAYDIMAEIRRNRMEAGAKLGSEAVLAQRFDVGRSTFREAARTLEFFGMVTVQRGSNGGLTVINPDPSMVVDTAALYLQYFGVEESGADALVEWLEHQNADLIGKRATHHELLELIEGVQTLAHTTARVRNTQAAQLLRAWTRLSDNRVLALSTEIVAQSRAVKGGRRKGGGNVTDQNRALNSAASRLRVAMGSSSERALAGALEEVATSICSCLGS